jgi:FAD-dependent halogenase
MHDYGEYDLVVIGGGPAGSTVATLVAMQNSRVLLLDRERFPRYQIGESLLPATIHGICRLLGVSEKIKAAGFVRKRGGTFLWGRNATPWTFDFSLAPQLGSDAGYAYQVERSKFDNILLQNARETGVDVREQHTVSDLIMNDRATGVTFLDENGNLGRVQAQFVVDASGHQTVLARRIGERHYSKFFQNIAVHGYYEGGRRLPSPNDGNILCASFPKGWFWYIPLSSSLTSVGAVIGNDHADLLKGDHDTALANLVEECPMIDELLRKARPVRDGQYGRTRVRKDYSYCHSRFWTPGVVLIGDAACFVDPVFSSGVHLGTYAALLAARSINTVLNGELSEDECFREFEMRYRREFGSFYQFLVAFYDTNRDEDSYFWEARRVLNSEERTNEAFLRLVSGISGTDQSIVLNLAEFLDDSQKFHSLFEGQKGTYLSRPEVVGSSSPGSNGDDPIDDLLAEITHVQTLGTGTAHRTAHTPLFPGGLVPSRDGLRWTRFHA